MRIAVLFLISSFCGILSVSGECWGSRQDVANWQQSRFSEAKRLVRLIYADHRRTFYCGCRYDKHNKVDLQSCGYSIQQDKRRARRLEWEHLMPVSLWGSHLPCWKQALCCKKSHCYKGRSCCRQFDLLFARMEADLHNIVPAIGELNALRSNYQFGILPSVQAGQFGACEIKIDPSIRQVEPPSQTRGAIARAYLYMSNRYGIALSKSQIQLFTHWNKQYPPTAWEIERNKRITGIQGNDNAYITHYQDKLE